MWQKALPTNNQSLPRMGPANDSFGEPGTRDAADQDNMRLELVGSLRRSLLCDRYGLRENPFGATPNPHYLYQSRTHGEAKSSLVIGIECGTGFQALIAPPGMGKTTLLVHVLQRFKNAAHTAFLFQRQGSSLDFLRYLALELGEKSGCSDLLRIQESINDLLVREFRSGRTTIIVVDEAQTLDNSVLETLRLLSNFETNTEKLLHIILAGQPQLAERLADPELAQLRQRISIIATLTPFNLEDTIKYIQHRLQVGGYQGPPLFTPEALRLIWRHSGGIPRNINAICFNSLLLANGNHEGAIDTRVVEEVIADRQLDIQRFSASQAGAGHGLRCAELSPSQPVRSNEQVPLWSALNEIARNVCRSTEATGVAIAIAEGEDMVCRARTGSPSPNLGVVVDSASGFTGICIRTALSLRWNDSEGSTEMAAAGCRALGIRSLVCIPIRQQHRVVAVCDLLSDRPGTFDGLDDMQLRHIAEQILAAINGHDPEHSVTVANPLTVSVPHDQNGEDIVECGAGIAAGPSVLELVNAPEEAIPDLDVAGNTDPKPVESAPDTSTRDHVTSRPRSFRGRLHRLARRLI
jgi:type II secretory pathway predicted ATPase ExeA